MFILYGILIGFVLGFALGGRLTGLSAIQFRWAPLILAGLVVQLILFSEPVTTRIGDLGPPIYVASTAAVLTAVIRNARIPGIAIVALGAASNLLAIAANGGYMPASQGALDALHRAEGAAYSNSALVASPALAPLTDIFALPRWLPFSNVFSVGDALIAVGVVVVVVMAMRTGSRTGDASPA